MSFLADIQQKLAAQHALVRASSAKAAPPRIPDMEIAGAPLVGQSLLYHTEPATFDQGFAHFRHWVYVVANHIASRVAERPIRIGQIVRKGAAATNRLHAPTFVKSQQTRLMADEEIVAINDGPLADVFERPNRLQSRYDLIYCCVASLLMTGEAYVIGGNAGGGASNELWAVPTGWIRPQHEGRLFSGYILQPHPQRKGIPLDVDQVARIYLPNPADPKGCISPVFTQLRAVHVDDHIQASQEMAFENGIFPSIALHVGRVDGKDKGPRRLLQPHQRRQLIAAVRKIYGGVARSGEPLILDALIESVSQITRAPREMDWNQSAELVRKRIFHAFGLNPINTGEIAGVNRAQAAVAEAHQCKNVINPLVEKLSSMLSNFVVPMFYEPEQADEILVWLEPATAIDEEQQSADWQEAAKLGFVTRNEYRRERLGLDVDNATDQTAMLANPQSLNAAASLAKSVAAGEIPESTAAYLLYKFFGVPYEEAVAALRGSSPSAARAASAGIMRLKAMHENFGGVSKAKLLEHREAVLNSGEQEMSALLERFFPGVV